jgi:hypothetical protein
MIDVRTPTSIVFINVNTLRPGDAPPTQPSSRTVALISASTSSRSVSVAGSNNPALATRLSASKVT